MKQEISLKKIYNEVTGDVFDMSNVSIFSKEIEKKVEDVYTLLCLWSTELSWLKESMFSKVSKVMFLGYMIA